MQAVGPGVHAFTVQLKKICFPSASATASAVVGRPLKPQSGCSVSPSSAAACEPHMPSRPSAATLTTPAGRLWSDCLSRNLQTLYTRSCARCRLRNKAVASTVLSRTFTRQSKMKRRVNAIRYGSVARAFHIIILATISCQKSTCVHQRQSLSASPVSMKLALESYRI